MPVPDLQAAAARRTTPAARPGRCCRPIPTPPAAGDPPADVFFVSPDHLRRRRATGTPRSTTPSADRLFRRVMAPNYAGPFVRVGRIFAPRYRQAGLYSLLTLRDDARDARAVRLWRRGRGLPLLARPRRRRPAVRHGRGGAGRHAGRAAAGRGDRAQPAAARAAGRRPI